MSPWRIVAALAFGFLLGGFAHLWFISDVGYGALISAGGSGYGWNTKSVGDGIAVGTIFYLLGLTFVTLSACAIVLAMIVGEWWYRRSFPFHRPRLRAFLPCLTSALLGAIGAVSLNQHQITENYGYYANLGEPFESRTIAIALPAMHAFTADCQRALLTLLLLALLSWCGERWLRLRRSPSAALAPLRRSGQ